MIVWNAGKWYSCWSWVVLGVVARFDIIVRVPSMSHIRFIITNIIYSLYTRFSRSDRYGKYNSAEKNKTKTHEENKNHWKWRLFSCSRRNSIDTWLHERLHEQRVTRFSTSQQPSNAHSTQCEHIRTPIRCATVFVYLCVRFSYIIRTQRWITIICRTKRYVGGRFLRP